MATRILFVCTGNTCRSPMAEGMLRALAEQAGVAVEVRSAGVAAMNGNPISQHSLDILVSMGAGAAKTSNALSPALIGWADLILTMTGSHKRALIGQYPDAVDKTHTLKEYVADDDGVLAAIQERERLAADLQIKHALGQQVSPAEWERLYKLEVEIPDFDVRDPFGGDKREYEKCAEEIEECLRKLLRRLEQENNDR